MPFFEEWESFYVIVGTAAAALIGLQFVVMALIAERPQVATPEAGGAFATPTVVHFSAVLLLSALMRAPWQSTVIVTALWGLVGFAGVTYGVIVARRMRRQTSYQPDREDWLFHFQLPLAAYALVFLSACAFPFRDHEALFGLGAAVLSLLFISIHNVWDTIAYQVFVRSRQKD